MGQFTLIKRNGTRIPLNKRNPFCAVKTAQQSRSLMADDTVTLEVVSTFLIDFEKGDKIKIDSDWYTIRTTVDRTKNSEDQYNYSITLYGCIYDLMKVMFRDTDVNGRSTSLTIDLTYSIKDFVKVIIYNMNRDYPGEWVFDDKDCPETEPKTVSFSCQNCLQTLQNECKDFDVDFQITTDKDGIHHIKIGKFGSVVTPPNGEKYFQWGRGHGLFSLVEGKVDDKAIITRMYGEGGTDNIPTAYRNYSERLQLPYPQRLNKHDHKLSDGTVVKAKTMLIGCTDDNKRYIEDAALSKKIGVEEDAIQNDDIYPKRTGKVTALGDDVYTFMDDTMDFDLKAPNSNGTTYLIDGTSAKITFITGRLAGREFELHDYDHSAKKFILKPYKDARGLVFPTSNTTAFQISEGDQYKITDIIMPVSYIEDAEEDLWFYVYDKFLQAKQARAQYALTFSRSYFIENMPKDSDSCLFTPGDYVPIKDERFNLEKNIRIQKVERNLLLRHDYTLTISDTATISIINQAVINVQKHDTILEANGLKDLTRAKYGWRTTEELRNMIYDPDGYFDTDNIKPNSIDTNMLTVGSKSQQFVLADVIMQANLGGDPNLFKATSGTLCHLSISDTDIRYWKIAALEATLSEAGGYYLFAKCSKKGDTGSWYLTQEQLKFELTSDPNNYYFQVGVLSSVYDASWRDFVTTYGFTRINGNTITTGKIVTSDGYCYLDLDGNKFRMGDKQSYIDYNVQQRGQITLHNVRLLSTSGDSSEIGVYRGEYNASYVYYKGDEVSYTNNGVTATYRYIYSEPTKGYAPTVGTYWQCIAKGKDGEKGTPGAPGEDGRTSYTHFKYSTDGGLSFTGNNGEEPGSYLGQYTDFEEMDSSNPTRYTWAQIQGEAGNSGVDAAASSYFECRYAKNGSTVEPPTLDATAPEPTGWSLQMPSVGKLEYLWMSMAQKSKLVEQTYCHIPFTAKDGCKDITGNYTTELGSGGSIVTEGDRQFLSLPDDSDLRIKYDLPFGENFTIFFWFKTDQKKIGWAIQDAAFTLNMKEMDVKPGTWMHLAFRFSDHTVSCFLNGVRQATASLNKKLIGFTVYDSNMYASANCYDEFWMVNGALADVDIVKVYQDKADKLLSNWSVPTRISPYDGKDGVSVMARYSSDKQNWHTSFQTGDQWMQTSSDSGNTWGEACKIVGEAGANGKYTDYSFATSKDLTTKDVFTSPRIYTTWSDAPVATTKDYPYLWMKVVEVDSNGKKSQARYTRLTGDPGKDGSDAVSRYLELSCTSVKVDKSGNVSPSKITAKQMKQVGGKAPENTADLYLVGLASSKSTATQLKAKSITINVSSSDSFVDFTLKDGSGNVYDTERVPVIKDGKDGTNGTNGKDGAPGTPGKDGRDGIDGKDGRDGTDGYSLAPIYRGEYSASKTYYGTQYRVDIVKYNGIYYVARVDAGTFYNEAPTNTSKWNPFGAQFESIATNLLLAEGANIGDWFLSGGKIVSTLSTTSSGKITLDAKGGLILVESATSGGDHSLYTTMGAKITLDANRGVIQATAKNAPSYSTGTAYMSPSGIFANMAGTDSISAPSGRSHRSAIVGLGFANVSKSAYELNDDETLVAGVYGRADNQGSAPAYGGYFWDLKACGLILNTRFIGDSSSYSERCIPKSVSFVIGLFNRDVVKDVYLPNDTKNGRMIKFKQMGAGVMRVRPMSGQHIYDDTSENDYYDCEEGQCLEFVFGIWVKGSTTTNVWTVSKYKYI